jgi:GNAT superfamily N-acetyltransferase
MDNGFAVMTLEVTPADVTAGLRALFDPACPGSLRFYAVLEGLIAGKIWTDSLHNPTWGIVQESAFGTLCLEGTFPDGFLVDFVKARQKHGDVLYGFWADDTRFEHQLPPPQYNGYVLESDHRSPQTDLAQYTAHIPFDCRVLPIDRTLFDRIQDAQFYKDMFGSAERALEKGFGFCLVLGGELVCEAFAGASAQGVIELGVNTAKAHTRKGYATITCAQLIQEAERRGWRTYWNCALQNQASTALARKLGYAPMQQYRLLGWF